MTPEEALKHVDGVCANHPGTRADHALLQQAVLMLVKVNKEWRTLKVAILPKPPEDEFKDKPTNGKSNTAQSEGQAQG